MEEKFDKTVKEIISDERNSAYDSAVLALDVMEHSISVIRRVLKEYHENGNDMAPKDLVRFLHTSTTDLKIDAGNIYSVIADSEDKIDDFVAVFKRLGNED